MSGSPERAPGRDRGARQVAYESLKYGLVAAAVWLAWEVVKAPIVDRAPPPLAARLAPTSPDVLRRLAEGELQAEEFDDAAALADESLARAPFNARTLRIRGLAEARIGNVGRADEMLTLAGNWSLRDDPAHGWLVERRLRQGNYNSAFAHADTLVRRRTEIYPQVFNLFTTAAINDKRALPALARLIAARPPWRAAYLDSLYARKDTDEILFYLAVALERTSGPMINNELFTLYGYWTGSNRVPLARYLRESTGRPAMSSLIQNADFNVAQDAQQMPFGWRPAMDAGLGVDIVPDEVLANNRAMRVDYDGYGSTAPVEQLLMLPAGEWVVRGNERTEIASPAAGLEWTVTCLETGARLGSYRPRTSVEDPKWRRFSMRVSVPSSNCGAQWIRLEARPGERRIPIVVWFDKFQITKVVSGTR